MDNISGIIKHVFQSILLNEYIPKDNKWTEVKAEFGQELNKKFVQSGVFVGPCVQSWCTIGSSKILLLHASKKYGGQSLIILGLNSSDSNNTGVQNTYVSKVIQVPSEYRKRYKTLTDYTRREPKIQGNTLIRVAHNKVILTGFHDSCVKNEFNREQLFWQGTLTSNETDMVWEKIELPGKWDNSGNGKWRLPIDFLGLKNNLYIVTLQRQASCDRYNLKEGKYDEGVHHLPHPLSCCTSTSNDDGSFALLVCKERGHMMTFTENEGFEEILNSPLMDLTTNLGHVLLRLK